MAIFEGCLRNGHRYFVADIALVPAEGKVVILALCTACGDPLTHERIVAAPHRELMLNSIQKKKLEQE